MVLTIITINSNYTILFLIRSQINNIIIKQTLTEKGPLKVIIHCSSWVVPLWGCTCTSHLIKLSRVSVIDKNKDKNKKKNKIKKTRTIYFNKYPLFRMSSRISWHHAFTYLVSTTTLLSLSLSLNIKTHDLSPKLSSQKTCTDFSYQHSYSIFKESVGERWFF